MLFFHRAKNRPWLIPVLVAALGALLAALFAMYFTGGFRTTLTLTLDQRPRPAKADFDYDGYYGLKAMELFGDTVAAWFATPTFAAEIYQAAGRPLPDEDVADATEHFRAKRVSSQTVVIRFDEMDKEAGHALAAAASGLVDLKASQLQQDEKGAPLFSVRAADMTILPNAVPPQKAAIIGFLIGGFLGAIGLFLARAPKP